MDSIVNFFVQIPASQSFNCHVGRLDVYAIYKAGQIASYWHDNFWMTRLNNIEEQRTSMFLPTTSNMQHGIDNARSNDMLK
jgi:hypothetical protein